MVDALFSIETFLLVLAVFGFMPDLALRVIVLAFPKDDPRRDELRAELHAVPRLERPLWVAEQIELAICEGLWGRFVRVASGRIIYRWRLRSGVKSHAKYPKTFWIPSEADKAAITPGDHVQLAFDVRGIGGERMWVDVREVRGRRIVGTLSNEPMTTPRLQAGGVIKFKLDHVINIHSHPEDCSPDARDPELMCPCCAKTRNDPA